MESGVPLSRRSSWIAIRVTMPSGDTRSRPGEIELLHAAIVLAREPTFRIGEAEFRPATREVIFAGRTSIIEPRVMQLLIALHRASGAVVSRDDLVQCCWDRRIVSEDAINRVVSRLRAVAENEAGGQFRIETSTKVGYRQVSATGEALDTSGDAPSAASASAARATRFFGEAFLNTSRKSPPAVALGM